MTKKSESSATDLPKVMVFDLDGTLWYPEMWSQERRQKRKQTQTTKKTKV